MRFRLQSTERGVYGQGLWECGDRPVRGTLVTHDMPRAGVPKRIRQKVLLRAGKDKPTLGLQGTEAGLGLGTDMLTGSGNG